tara:strand:+ start:1366 stop:1791 length:426 start_codon:yes stop_codon:yes gene_type:complete
MKSFILGVVLTLATGSSGIADTQATQLVNSIRAANGRAGLVYSPKLEAAARVHALDMAKHGYFAHEGRNGKTVGDRVRNQGYEWCFVAENLAKGQRDLNQVMQGWAASPGHYKNLISNKAAAFGLAQGPGRIWAMVLAAPC